jgi:twitching motility protein PilT
MQTMNQSLYSLYTRRLISLEDAMQRSNDPDEFKSMMATGESNALKKAQSANE